MQRRAWSVALMTSRCSGRKSRSANTLPSSCRTVASCVAEDGRQQGQAICHILVHKRPGRERAGRCPPACPAGTTHRFHNQTHDAPLHCAADNAYARAFPVSPNPSPYYPPKGRLPPSRRAAPAAPQQWHASAAPAPPAAPPAAPAAPPPHALPGGFSGCMKQWSALGRREHWQRLPRQRERRLWPQAAGSQLTCASSCSTS